MTLDSSYRNATSYRAKGGKEIASSTVGFHSECLSQLCKGIGLFLCQHFVAFGLETSVAVRHANDPHRDSLNQEQSVAVEKDPFNIVHQDYIINYQW